MADNRIRIRSSLASAAILFILVVFFQLVLELIFGDAIDARFLFQAVLTSAIMTVLFLLFERWRKRR
jgi:hypothetical protein